MKIQTPSIKALAKELTSYKGYIEDEFIEEEGDDPFIQVTLACDEKGFALQTGDNSYTGPAYFYRHWGVGSLTRKTNCRELAKDLIEQCRELAYY